MTIAFACGCGKKLQMGDEWAGKRARCPGCQAVVTVPGPAAEAVPAVPAGPRAWLFPPGTENRLVVLADDSLWVRSTVFVSVRPEYTRLQSGGDPADALGPEATRIRLADVYQVELDRKRDNLVVRYTEADKDGKRVNRSKEVLVEDRGRRDEVFDALRERLGPGWHVREKRQGPLETVGIGATCLVLTAAALWLLLGLIHWLQGPDPLEGLRGRFYIALLRLVVYLLQGVMRAMGFVADVVAYALAALLAVIFVSLMVSQLRTPPLFWYLEKGEAATPAAPARSHA